MLAKACTTDSDGGVTEAPLVEMLVTVVVIVVSVLSLLRSLQDVGEVRRHCRGHRGVVVTLDAVRRNIRNHPLDISFKSGVGQEVWRRCSERITRSRLALSRVR